MSSTAEQVVFDLLDQPSFAKSPEVDEAVRVLASNGGIEERGAIFTRREVVDFILDLIGYSPSQPLFRLSILEPSFGAGDFLIPIVERLLISCKELLWSHEDPVQLLASSIRAVELHQVTFQETRNRILDLLITNEISAQAARELCSRWLFQGDFLLHDWEMQFDMVAGNPPYVRQELIPAPLLSEYRRRFKTMYDRADLYIAFIERSLSLLNQKGKLGFICADRWMKNRYGGPLRQMVAENFHFKAYVDMVNTDAFLSEVSAYPAITVIERGKTAPTRIAHRPRIDSEALAELRDEFQKRCLGSSSPIRELENVVAGSEPWLLESSDQMALIRRIEKDYPLLEEVGCKVGIGVATGADKAFIDEFEALDVEDDRKLPLVATGDIQSGEVVWQGNGVINPFADDGSLVDLDKYPRLARYLESRKEVIAKRHCATKTPANWYRTIDRIWPKLVEQPKLLIPDIKGEAHIVYEKGELYPHHNLYYVTSRDWDLRALQAVLLSSLAKLFISTYSTKMRGGFLRFQAQYLRRIRIPMWEDVPSRLREELSAAAVSRNLDACNQAVFNLYKLNMEERAALGGNGNGYGN
jgi:hypothetical protein